MLKTFLVFLIFSIGFISGNQFTFVSTSEITSTENWLHGEIPCNGDRIRFDNTLPVVAFMDHNVNVESITLPDNGIIVFSDNGVDLGGDVNWQCSRNSLEDPKDVFFTRSSRHDSSFFNPNNWRPDTNHFLHMNQVPGGNDNVTVISMSSAQLYLDMPVTVNTFKFYNREVSRFFECSIKSWKKK